MHGAVELSGSIQLVAADLRDWGGSRVISAMLPSVARAMMNHPGGHQVCAVLASVMLLGAGIIFAARTLGGSLPL